MVPLVMVRSAYVTSPRAVHTSVVKKSAATSAGQCACTNVCQVIGRCRPGGMASPRRMRAIVEPPARWPTFGLCRSVLDAAGSGSVATRIERFILPFRFVPPLAAVCPSLVHRKGKKRAMSPESFPDTTIAVKLQ